MLQEYGLLKITFIRLCLTPLRRCKDPTAKEDLVARRDFLASEIGSLREKINIAKRIIKDRPGLEESLEAEKALIREWYFPERAQVKEKHYEGR